MDLRRLDARLERLERQNRRLKRGGLAICGCAFLALLLGQAAPPAKSIEARRVVLVDDEGKVRGEIGVAKNGSIGVVFTDIHGKARLKLGVDGDQTSKLELLNQDEKPRVSLTDPFVRNVVNNEERIDWRTYGFGLSLHSGEGDPRTTLPVASFGLSNGAPYVSFTDKLPSLSFRDEEGRKHWEVPPPKKDER